MPDLRARPCRPYLATLAGLLLLFALLATGTSVQAQPGEAAAEAVTVSELEALVETLDDPARRDEFVSSLRTLIEARRATDEEAAVEADDNLLAQLSVQIDEAGGQLVSALQFALNLPAVRDWAESQFTDPVARGRWLEVIGKVIATLVAGLIAEWLVRWALARPRRSIERRGSERLIVRIPFLLVRTVLDILPLAAFAAIAYGVLPLLDPSLLARLAALAIINANVLVRAVAVVARLLLAPAAPALRIPEISTETATYLYIWTRRIANVTIYGYFLLEALRLVGMPFSAYAVLLKLLGLVVTGLLVVFILQNREPVAGFIRGNSGTGHGAMRILRARFADVWHVIAIAYLLGTFIIWALQVEGGFEFLFRATILTFVILLAARAIAALVKRAFHHGFAVSKELKQRFPGFEEHANRYLPVLQTIVLAVVYLVALLGILAAWGVDSFGWVTSEAGQEAIGSVAKILAVVFVSVLVWELVRSAIDRYLSKTDRDGNVVERTARAKTLLPLLQRVAFIFLALIAGLIVLSEVGIDIGPLLAGAGIVGLAVGFGAQTLVKDIITGVFILVEDHFAVGDVVTVGGKGGLVEAISIRTIRLRDLSGTVHMIPFSEVTATENLTKDFSYYVLDVGVAYREDTDEVVEVLKGLAREMEQDPEYGRHILPPFEVLGVNAFADSAVVIKCRIKTLPIQQWYVGREFNRRMKKRFDELGIEIPFPHRTVYFGVDKAGGAPPARVAMEGTSREIPMGGTADPALQGSASGPQLPEPGAGRPDPEEPEQARD